MYNELIMFPARNGDGIFKELEIFVMPDSFMKAMIPLINHNVGEHLQDFFIRFEEMGIREQDNDFAKGLSLKIDRMKELWGDRIKRVTYFKQIKEDPDLKRIHFLSVDKIASMNSTQRQELKVKLSNLIANRDFLISKIEARKMDDFKTFISECKLLEGAASQVEMRLAGAGATERYQRTHAIDKWVGGRDSDFYRNNEKEFITGMESYRLVMPVVEEYISGIEHLEYIRERRLPLHTLRQIRLE